MESRGKKESKINVERLDDVRQKTYSLLDLEAS